MPATKGSAGSPVDTVASGGHSGFLPNQMRVRQELGRGSLLQFEPKFFDDWVGQQLMAHLGHGTLGFGAVGLVDIDQQVFAYPHVASVFEAEAMEAGQHSDALRVVHRGLKGNVDSGLVIG